MRLMVRMWEKKMSWIYNWSITAVFLTAILIIIFKYKSEEEAYFPIKIIGYYLLGAFKLILNKFPIPVGFLIFFLFMQSPQRNKRSKNLAAFLGLISFLISVIVPAATEAYFERTRHVEAETLNIYEFNFKSHWDEVARVLEFNDNDKMSARIENVNIDYEKTGRIERLRYEVIWRQENKFHHAFVDYSGEKFNVKASKIANWTQYDRLINADILFQKLNNVGIEKLTPKGIYAKYGFIFRGRDSFAIKHPQTYIIEDLEVKTYAGELPIECFWIQVFGMNKNPDSSYGSGSDDFYYYLFD